MPPAGTVLSWVIGPFGHRLAEGRRTIVTDEAWHGVAGQGTSPMMNLMMRTVAEVVELEARSFVIPPWITLVSLALAVVVAVLLLVWLWFRLQRQKP